MNKFKDVNLIVYEKELMYSNLIEKCRAEIKEIWPDIKKAPEAPVKQEQSLEELAILYLTPINQKPKTKSYLQRYVDLYSFIFRLKTTKKHHVHNTKNFHFRISNSEQNVGV